MSDIGFDGDRHSHRLIDSVLNSIAPSAASHASVRSLLTEQNLARHNEETREQVSSHCQHPNVEKWSPRVPHSFHRGQVRPPNVKSEKALQAYDATLHPNDSASVQRPPVSKKPSPHHPRPLVHAPTPGEAAHHHSPPEQAIERQHSTNTYYRPDGPLYRKRVTDTYYRNPDDPAPPESGDQAIPKHTNLSPQEERSKFKTHRHFHKHEHTHRHDTNPSDSDKKQNKPQYYELKKPEFRYIRRGDDNERVLVQTRLIAKIVDPQQEESGHDTSKDEHVEVWER